MYQNLRKTISFG